MARAEDEVSRSRYRAEAETRRLRIEVDNLSAALARSYEENLQLRAAIELTASKPGLRSLFYRSVGWLPSTRVLIRRAWRHYRTHGGRSLVERVRQLPRYRTWGLEPIGADLPDGVVPNDPRLIFSCLDRPIEGAVLGDDHLDLQGWAWSEDGISTVEFYIDGEFVQQTGADIKRPDVAGSLGHRMGSLASGFRDGVPIKHLTPGLHRLVVAVRDENHRCRVFARNFRTIGASDAYDIYYRATLPRRVRRGFRHRVRARGRERVRIWVGARGDGDLEATLASLSAQTYAEWRCTVFNASEPSAWADEQIRSIVVRTRDRRIRFEAGRPQLEQHDSPSHHAFMLDGEVLAPRALHDLVTAATHEAVIVYSDHDQIGADSIHRDPVFAPSWSPEHVLSRNYVGGFFLVRDGTWRQGRDWRTELGSDAWRYELLLAVTAGKSNVVHVPRVLWSAPYKELPDTRALASEMAAVVADHYRRQSIVANVSEASAYEPGGTGPIRRIGWDLAAHPRVSIIIPTTGKLDYVRTCVESIIAHTAYPNYELVFIDNSRGMNGEGIDYIRARGIKVIERNEPFNWAKLSNAGARESNGEILLFLNDDIEASSDDWLTEMVRQGDRDGVGAVGAMLLYPDGLIQHAGVFLVDHGGGAMHLFQWLDPADELYGNLHRVPREVSANTGACLLVRRDRFEEVGGFDERFTVALNDIDFCLRLMERGYRNIWTPYTTLIHHEKASRTHINVDHEERLMHSRWGSLLAEGDPYFNPNFARNYTDCRLDLSHLSPATRNLDPSWLVEALPA